MINCSQIIISIYLDHQSILYNYPNNPQIIINRLQKDFKNDEQVNDEKYSKHCCQEMWHANVFSCLSYASYPI